MKMNNKNVVFLLFAGVVMVLAIWGPEKLAAYKDKYILNQPKIQVMETAGEGYRYSLSRKERLFILAESLNSQTLPESEHNALTRTEVTDLDYELSGTYAFVVNHKGPTGKEITEEEIFSVCNQGLAQLKESGILPETVREAEASLYDAVLYSAIDILEPRNNVAVWKLSLNNSQKNAHKENRLMDAYIDADDGKLYEFYVRTAMQWEDIDTDDIIQKWTGYLGLPDALPYESENPLMETTPYFNKYVIENGGQEKTIITIGFYEGINELFLKISK